MSIRSTPLTLAASSAKGNCPILADSSELGAILLPNNSLQQKHTSELKPSRVSLIYSSAEDYANDNAQIINFNAVSIFIKGNSFYVAQLVDELDFQEHDGDPVGPFKRSFLRRRRRRLCREPRRTGTKALNYHANLFILI